MSTQRVELFALSANTPAGTLVHGGALVRATAEAGASLHRGFSAAARFDLVAEVDASIREGVAASFRAGVDVSAAVALQAQMPLDLFTGRAGAIAAFVVQLEAAAHVSATIGLELDVFRNLLRAHVGTGPLLDLVDICFDEAVVEAGFWAKASFGAEIAGEASLTGSLLPAPGEPAGFSFAFDASAGVGFGAGVRFLANFGFRDPRRLVNRLSQTLSQLVIAEAERLVATLPADEAVAARRAVGVLKVLLPMAVRSAYEVGAALVASTSDQQRGTAAAGIVQGFVREAQAALVEALFQLAIDEIGAHLRGVEVLDRLAALDDAERLRVLGSVRSLLEALGRLAEYEGADADWIPAVLQCVDALAGLIEAGVVPGGDDLLHGVAVFYAAASIGHRVGTWVATPGPGVPPLFQGTAPAAHGAVSSHIAAAIGKTAGQPLDLLDLVTFVLGGDPLGRLRSEYPAIEAVAAWLTEILGLTPDQNLLGYLLTQLSNPTDTTVQQLLERLGAGLGHAIEQDVVPNLLRPLKTAADPALTALVDGVVVPSLVALPGVVLPNLVNLGQPDADLRFRETLSALLVLSVERFVTTSANILIQHALGRAEADLRTLAQRVEDPAIGRPGFGAMAAVSSRAALPVALTPPDAAGILTLGADAALLLNTRVRQPVFDAIDALFTLGLDRDATRMTALTTIATTSAEVDHGTLSLALDRLSEGSLDLVMLVIPRALELVALHFIREAQALALAIDEAARDVVTAAEQTVNWIVQQAGELAALIEQLTEEITAAAARVAATLSDLATRLLELVGQAVEAIRAAGWELVRWIVPDEWEPDVRRVYDAIFNGIRWILEAPLQILRAVADVAYAALTQRVAGGPIDAPVLDEVVRRSVYSLPAPTIEIPIRFSVGPALVDLGSFAIPGGASLNAVVTTAVTSDVYRTRVGAALGDANELRTKAAQRVSLEARLANQLSTERAVTLNGSITTGRALAIAISSPTPRTTYVDRARLAIRIAGANGSFVRTPLGVPRRVSVRVNGVEYPYLSGQWTDDGTALSFAADIVLPAVTAPALRFAAAPPLVIEEEVIPVGTALRAVDTEDGLRTMRLTGADATAAIAAAAPDTIVIHDGTARLRFEDPAAGEWGVTRLPIRGMRMEPVASLWQDTTDGLLPDSGTIADRFERDLDVHWDRPLEPSQPPPLLGRLGLNAVQVAVSDGASAQPQHAAVTFYLTPLRAPAAGITVGPVVANPPGEDVAGGEHVVIRSAALGPTDMTGWTLVDFGERHRFTFGRFVLDAGREVRVWTRPGANDASNLYWGRRAAVWNNPGDVAVLRDAAGREVGRFAYGVAR